MKRSKFTEEQITYALRQHDAGTPVGNICRQLGVSAASFYAWKKKYVHMGVSELRELRQLRDENARLKRLVADLTLDKQILTDAVKKSFEAGETPGTGALDGRPLSGQRTESLRVRVVFPCRLVPEEPGSDQAALRRRIREIAHSRLRFGYLRIHVMLRREGWRINRKRVHRLYRLEGLQLRRRMRRRQHMCLHCGVVPKATHPHQRLSMDFVHDQLFDARPFRILTVIDQWSREAVIVEPRFRFRGSDMADLLDRWVAAHGAPETITVARYGVHVKSAGSVA